jgi:hypothetical protein
VKLRMSILRLKSMIRRVCVSSPPSRTSLATGKSATAPIGGPDAPVRSAAEAPPRTAAPKRQTKIAARTNMALSAPAKVLLHYGGAVNSNLKCAVAAAPKPSGAPLPLPIASPNKGVLTSYSSGRATFGHPAGRKDRSLTRDGRGFRGKIWSAASLAAGPRDQQSRCSCGHRRGSRWHMPRMMRGGVCSESRSSPSRTSSAKRISGCAYQRCRPHRPRSCYDCASRPQSIAATAPSPRRARLLCRLRSRARLTLIVSPTVGPVSGRAVFCRPPGGERRASRPSRD